MRLFLNLVLAVCIAAGIAVIYIDASKPAAAVVTNTGVPLRVNMMSKEKLREDLSGGLQEALSAVEIAGGEVPDATCFVWGPFKAKSLRTLEPVLQNAKLLQKMEISDRFLPERYIVYLGPYVNKVAAIAFVKQFRQQGFKHVRAIVQGDLAYGVEIEAFKTREEAQEYLDSGKAPEVQGLRVTNRLGEPSNEVDLIFRALTSDERSRLFSVWKENPGTKLKSCSFFGY